MKILFAGSPDFALPSIRMLAESCNVVGVLTAPDRRRGRGGRVVASPVALEAAKLNLPMLRPERLGSEARQSVTELGAELLVVVAYGKIFGPRFLSLFSKGGINLHPSLLPKLRGPAPIPAAILSGQSETGCTVQRVGVKMDAGAILDQEHFTLSGDESTASLSRRFADIGAEQLLRVISGIESGTVIDTDQQEADATYCSLIEKDSGRITWSESSAHIERMIRAYDPWPTAFTYWNGLRLSILRATTLDGLEPSPTKSVGAVVGVDKKRGILIQTGEGTLAVEHLQLQSKRPLPFREFLNGSPKLVGSILGETA